MAHHPRWDGVSGDTPVPKREPGRSHGAHDGSTYPLFNPDGTTGKAKKGKGKDTGKVKGQGKQAAELPKGNKKEKGKEKGKDKGKDAGKEKKGKAGGGQAPKATRNVTQREISKGRETLGSFYGHALEDYPPGDPALVPPDPAPANGAFLEFCRNLRENLTTEVQVMGSLPIEFRDPIDWSRAFRELRSASIPGSPQSWWNITSEQVAVHSGAWTGCRVDERGMVCRGRVGTEGVCTLLHLCPFNWVHERTRCRKLVERAYAYYVTRFPEKVETLRIKVAMEIGVGSQRGLELHVQPVIDEHFGGDKEAFYSFVRDEKTARKSWLPFIISGQELDRPIGFELTEEEVDEEAELPVGFSGKGRVDSETGQPITSQAYLDTLQEGMDLEGPLVGTATAGSLGAVATAASSASGPRRNWARMSGS